MNTICKWFNQFLDWLFEHDSDEAEFRNERVIPPKGKR